MEASAASPLVVSQTQDPSSSLVPIAVRLHRGVPVNTTHWVLLEHRGIDAVVTKKQLKSSLTRQLTSNSEANAAEFGRAAQQMIGGRAGAAPPLVVSHLRGPGTHLHPV